MGSVSLICRMENLDIVEQLFDSKLLAVLRKFYEFDKKEFYIRELSKKSRVSLATTFRIVRRLVDLGLVNEIKVAKFKVYRLGDNEKTRFLGQLIKKQKQALQVFVTKAKDLRGLQKILLQGKEEKDRANIILIGNNFDLTEIKQICAAIKEQFEYNVSPLTVDEEQFAQMKQMMPTRTKTLFEK